MAVCTYCNKDMADKGTVTCVGVAYFVHEDGKNITCRPIPYEGEWRCHDCNIATGGFHHPGCDMEECANCGGQLISCGCLDEGEPDDGEECELWGEPKSRP